MARTGGYVVLAKYASHSSSTMHEVRRGGDGVLYCTCKGWQFNKSVPKSCTHCREYIAEKPGTLWGPPGMFAVDTQATRQAAKSANFGIGMVNSGSGPASLKRKRAAVAEVAAQPAPANWRDLLLEERREATKRVETPPEALQLYARDLDLGD